MDKHNPFMWKVFNDQKHFKHILTNEDLARMTIIEKRYPIGKLPVCQSCERVAYWNKGGTAICPKCGTITKNPITLSEYMVKGYDLDKTANQDKDWVEKEQIVRKMLLPEKLKI